MGGVKDKEEEEAGAMVEVWWREESWSNVAERVQDGERM